MTGTVEERADYKSSMRPYLIGVFIFFALSQLLSVIIDLIPGFFEQVIVNENKNDYKNYFSANYNLTNNS